MLNTELSKIKFGQRWKLIPSDLLEVATIYSSPLIGSRQSRMVLPISTPCQCSIIDAAEKGKWLTLLILLALCSYKSFP